MVHPRNQLFEQIDLPILGDGAMGTLLNLRGVGFDAVFRCAQPEQPSHGG